MRKGFTMIELVFVIVILGILAAIAVPRLAASRDDALLASLKSDMATAASAVPAWYQGQKDVRISKAMSLSDARWEQQGNNEDYVAQVDDVDCVQMRIMDMEEDETEATGYKDAGSVAADGTDYDSDTGEWDNAAATGVPVLQITRHSSGKNVDNCDALFDDMGAVDDNISVAGRRIKW